MFAWTATTYDKEIEECTSTANIVRGSIDYPALLDLADCLKSSKYNAKQFVKGLVKRMASIDGNVLLNTMQLVDTCVKNAGQSFQIQLSCREFVDIMASLSRNDNQQVRLKAREFIQLWALLFKGNSDLFLITELFENLKRSGIDFPRVSIPISAALIETTLAPPWIDSEMCQRCRTSFTTFNRKHHCRNCGNVFCQDCSSKSISLPALGVIEPVRVCETCHYKFINPSKEAAKISDTASTGHSQDESDLQKAIEASLRVSNPKPKEQKVAFSDDTDLERAIKESLRESRKERVVPQPVVQKVQPPPEVAQRAPAITQIVRKPTNDLSELQISNLNMFSSLVEAQAHEIGQKGYSTFNPLPLQTLFAQVSSLHPQLTASIHESADLYKELYEMNSALHEVIGQYDIYLQQRLQYSQSRNSYTFAPPNPYGNTLNQGVPQQFSPPPGTKYFPPPAQNEEVRSYGNVPDSDSRPNAPFPPTIAPYDSNLEYRQGQVPFGSQPAQYAPQAVPQAPIQYQGAYQPPNQPPNQPQYQTSGHYLYQQPQLQHQMGESYSPPANQAGYQMYQQPVVAALHVPEAPQDEPLIEF